MEEALFWFAADRRRPDASLTPDFNRRFLETRDGRGIKSSPDFIAMREQVLGIIYGDERAAPMSTPVHA